MKIVQNMKFDGEVIDVMIGVAMGAKRTKITRYLLGGLGGVYLTIGLIFLIQGSFSPIFMAGGAFLLFFGVFYVPIIIRSNVRKMNKMTIGKTVTYICDDDGIEVTSEYGESHYEWTAVQLVRDLNAYVGLTLVNQNTLLLRKADMTEEQYDWLMARANA